jgi:hypothetical protein
MKHYQDDIAVLLPKCKLTENVISHTCTNTYKANI